MLLTAALGAACCLPCVMSSSESSTRKYHGAQVQLTTVLTVAPRRFMVQRAAPAMVTGSGFAPGASSAFEEFCWQVSFVSPVLHVLAPSICITQRDHLHRTAGRGRRNSNRL